MPVMNPATNLIYNMDKNMVASKRGHRLEIKLARCFDPPPASSTEIFPFTSTEDYNIIPLAPRLTDYQQKVL